MEQRPPTSGSPRSAAPAFSRSLGGVLVAAVLLAAFNAGAAPSHGASIYGPDDLKLGPNDPFPYVNPDAPKGGRLSMRSGNFTTLNPYTLKGLSAPLMDLIFENPTVQSGADNEPFAEYGHLAQTIDIAEDHLSLVYTIHPEARFSDGVPVTADDFVFSFEVMKHPEYSPNLKQYFADIKGATRIDDHSVRFTFARRNQELPLIVGQMPILPKHIYGATGKDFAKDFDTLAVGSGPYILDSYEFGKYVTVRRNPDWWAKDLPKSQGRFNFDTITAKVYLDEIAMKEAFKGGDFDILHVNVSKDWALDFHGPFVQKRYILRRELPHQRPVGMQGFVFNLRNPVFQSLKTRYAIAMVFDFPWANTNLFYGQYERTRCFLENSPDMTRIAPPQGRQLEYLQGLRATHGASHVPKMALREPLHAPGQELAPAEAMRQAEILLDSVGWVRGEDGIRVREGKRLGFELMLSDQHWQRIAEPYQKRLAELGVVMEVKVVQPAEFQKQVRAFQFDSMVQVFSHSRSIGNEQTYFFSSEAADTEGSMNLAGLKNPAVDEVLSKVVEAKTREDLAFYGQILDRLLTANVLVVPQWHIKYDRVLTWNRFGRPAAHCSQMLPSTVIQNHWWYDASQAAKLREAMDANIPMKTQE